MGGDIFLYEFVNLLLGNDICLVLVDDLEQSVNLVDKQVTLNLLKNLFKLLKIKRVILMEVVLKKRFEFLIGEQVNSVNQFLNNHVILFYLNRERPFSY